MEGIIILMIGIVIGATFGYPIGQWAARKKAQWRLVRNLWR